MAQALPQRGRLRRRVVDAPQDDVLEEELAPRALDVPRARGEEVVQGIRPVERHEAIAQLVGGRVQADGQVELQRLRREPVDRRGRPPPSTRRSSARRQPEPRRVVEQATGAERLVVVVERLAHAHEDDVGDPALALGAKDAGEVQDLVDDLLGRQVPPQPEPAGGAEAAPDGAADLRRDADGGAARHEHEDGFDRMAVRRREERLARRASRRGARLHLHERDRRQPLRQRLSQRPRERRDGREVGDQAARERLVDLARAVRGLTQIGQRGRDDVGIEHPAIVRRQGGEGMARARANT